MTMDTQGGGVSGRRPLMRAVGPLPAKQACLPQGLEVGVRSAPQLLVYYNLFEVSPPPPYFDYVIKEQPLRLLFG